MNKQQINYYYDSLRNPFIKEQFDFVKEFDRLIKEKHPKEVYLWLHKKLEQKRTNEIDELMANFFGSIH